MSPAVFPPILPDHEYRDRVHEERQCQPLENLGVSLVIHEYDKEHDERREKNRQDRERDIDEKLGGRGHGSQIGTDIERISHHDQSDRQIE